MIGQPMVVDFERVEQVVRAFSSAVTNRRIYGGDHARTDDSERCFLQCVREYLAANSSEERFRLGLRDGRFTHDGIVIGDGPGELRLAAELERRRYSSISFLRELDEQEIGVLCAWLDRGGSEPSMWKGVELTRDQPDEEETAPDDEDVPEALRLPVRVYRTAFNVLERVMREARETGEPDLGEVLEVSRWTAEECFRLGTRLLCPIQLLKQDSYTYQHSLNVFLIATTMLQPLAKDSDELTRWARAALLHDIGKCRVPEYLLYKRGHLTEEEYQLVKRHTEYGAELLFECGESDPLVIEVAYCHHMRDDGLGYPVLRLPLEPGPITNVVQVADMFEAMTADRPYKGRRPVSEAVHTIMQTPGMSSKNPALQLLLDRLTDLPPGAGITLETGEQGLILAHERALEVLILSDAEGNATDEVRSIDETDVADVELKPDLNTEGLGSWSQWE